MRNLWIVLLCALTLSLAHAQFPARAPQRLLPAKTVTGLLKTSVVDPQSVDWWPLTFLWWMDTTGANPGFAAAWKYPSPAADGYYDLEISRDPASTDIVFRDSLIGDRFNYYYNWPSRTPRYLSTIPPRPNPDSTFYTIKDTTWNIPANWNIPLYWRVSMRWVWFWVTLDSNANMQYIYRTGKEFWTTVDEFILLGKTITQGSNPPPHARLVLAQSFPNPSYHGVVTINYSLLTSGVVKLALYDLLGREIVVLDDSFRASGDYAVRFDTATLTAGVYFYRIFSGNTMKVRTLVVLK